MKSKRILVAAFSVMIALAFGSCNEKENTAIPANGNNGNGGNSAAVCEHSFIELTNTKETPISLGGLALYYMTGNKSEYISFKLPEIKLESGNSCLIRCASSSSKTSEYKTSNEIIRIEDFDAEWDVAINNKDIKLLIAPAGLKLNAAEPPETLWPGSSGPASESSVIS